MTAPNEPWARRLADPELELDLEAERAVPLASDEAKARIFAAVQLVIVQPPTPPTTPAPVATATATATTASTTSTAAVTATGGGVALKGLVAVAVLASAVGGGWWARRPAPEPAPTVAVTAEPLAQKAPASAIPSASVATPPTAAPAPASVAAASPPSAAAPLSAAPRAATRPAVHAALPDEDAPVAGEPGRPHPVATPTSTLGDEQALLEAARRALAAGDPRGALAAVATHERRFIAGGLAEERDVLRIQAHARAGRMDETRAFAERFRARYPRSLLRAAVDYALGGGETP